MSDAVPAVDGLYLDRRGTAWRREDDWLMLASRPSHAWDLSKPEEVEEVTEYGPFDRLIAFTDEELTELHDIAGQIADATRLNARGADRWGNEQPTLTRELIHADIWRSITEKTGAS